MVAVFSIFATLSVPDFKQMGVGLATAILVDATIVRAVLLPATMTLLGEPTGICRGGWSGCRRCAHEEPADGEAAGGSIAERPARKLTPA